MPGSNLIVAQSNSLHRIAIQSTYVRLCTENYFWTTGCVQHSTSTFYSYWNFLFLSSYYEFVSVAETTFIQWKSIFSRLNEHFWFRANDERYDGKFIEIERKANETKLIFFSSYYLKYVPFLWFVRAHFGFG